MIDEHTDLTWVGERLPTVESSELAGPDRARGELLAHITAAGESLPARTSHPTRGDRHAARRHGGRRRRRVLALGTVGVAAAAAAFAVVNVTSGDHAGSVPEASAKQIIARASSTPDPTGDQVLAYTLVDQDNIAEQTAENGNDPQDWAIQRTSPDGKPLASDGQEGGRREFYDPSTNTIYRDATASMTVGLSASDSAFFGEMNAAGAQTTVDSNATTADGRPATEVTSTETDGNEYQLWVDPDNRDRPLQFVWTKTSGQSETLVWRGYQTVTPGNGTASPARLSDAHPSATVRTLDGAQFKAAHHKAGL